METEEDRRAKLENDVATKQLRLAIETDEERKARLEKMVSVGLGDRKKEEQNKRMDFIYISFSKTYFFQGTS